MRVLWAVLLVTVSLAGCSADTPAATVQTCQEESCIATIAGADAVDTNRDIRGVVVDETVTPVPLVRITLWQAGEKLAALTTDDQGAFTLRGVPDGFYRLVAARDGFDSTETQLDVGPSTKGTLRVQIISQPPIVPIHTLLKWDGIVGCSVRIVNGGAQVCSLIVSILGDPSMNDHSRGFYDEIMEAGRAPSWAQAELHWESNQAAGDALMMDAWRYAPTGQTIKRVGIAEGLSPLTTAFDAKAIEDHGIGQATNVSMPHGLRFSMWSGSENNLVPAATIQQDFTLFFSLIYNVTPPEGWTFLRDGALT